MVESTAIKKKKKLKERSKNHGLLGQPKITFDLV